MAVANNEIVGTYRKPNDCSMATRVKICGITRVEDALAAAHVGADAVGFVFWQRSARYVTAEKAREIIAALPPFLAKVGVYVDPDPDWVRETSSLAGLDLLQFHGDEPPAFCRQFTLPYIKAVRVRAGLDLLQYATFYKGAQRATARYLCCRRAGWDRACIRLGFDSADFTIAADSVRWTASG